jgi:two-component system NtrC family sensor kinase
MNKILIVDDSKLMLRSAKDILLKNKGNEVVLFTCNNAEDALTLISDEHFDIVLLDIIMPNLSGIELLKILHDNNQLQTTKVLMFSSITDKKALKECFALGATDFITKPIDEDEFIARISNALNEQNLENLHLHTIELMKSQNDELANLYTQLSDAENQIIQQQQMAGVGYLAAGIAHEINNPIGFIKSNIFSLRHYVGELMGLVADYETTYGKMPSTPDSSRLDIDFIRDDSIVLYSELNEGIDRIEHIVNSLRSFSTIDDFNQLAEIDLSKALEDILVLINSEIAGHVRIEKHFPSVPKVIVNGGEIQIALLNILKNALYAVESDCKTEQLIKLTLDEDPDFVYCHIWDNGIGISNENLKTIFNPFFTTKPVGDGIGLGLSMAYNIIVTKHNGHMEVSSQESEWTQISIGFPKLK